MKNIENSHSYHKEAKNILDMLYDRVALSVRVSNNNMSQMSSMYVEGNRTSSGNSIVAQTFNTLSCDDIRDKNVLFEESNFNA